MSDRQHLLQRLRDAGLSQAEIDRAAAEGRLPTLAVEMALGGTGRHTLSAVARQSRLQPDFLRELLQALGRPNPGRGERVLGDEDIEIARLVRRLREAGIPRQELVEIARVLGQGMAHVAESVQRAVGDALLQPGDAEHTVGLRYLQAADQLGPLAPRLFDYAFRMHLRDGISNALVTEAEREAGRLAGTRDVAVAFADLVGYTRMGHRLPPEDVGRIAGRLAAMSTRALHRPTRLVKTIGDAAMFVSPDVPAMVRTVGALREAVAGCGEDFPDIRAGVAYGPATPRGGDWFGGTVNLASRITDAAKAGQVMACESVQERSPDAPWKRRRKRSLKGVDGRVRLFSLEQPAEEAPAGAA